MECPINAVDSQSWKFTNALVTAWMPSIQTEAKIGQFIKKDDVSVSLNGERL